MLKLIIFTIITIFVTLDAQAYIGPGAGIGAILTGLGFILLVILLIVSILIYPFKWIMKKIKNKKKNENKEN